MVFDCQNGVLFEDIDLFLISFVEIGVLQIKHVAARLIEACNSQIVISKRPCFICQQKIYLAYVFDHTSSQGCHLRIRMFFLHILARCFGKPVLVFKAELLIVPQNVLCPDSHNFDSNVDGHG